MAHTLTVRSPPHPCLSHPPFFKPVFSHSFNLNPPDISFFLFPLTSPFVKKQSSEFSVFFVLSANSMRGAKPTKN